MPPETPAAVAFPSLLAANRWSCSRVMLVGGLYVHHRVCCSPSAFLTCSHHEAPGTACNVSILVLRRTYTRDDQGSRNDYQRCGLRHHGLDNYQVPCTQCSQRDCPGYVTACLRVHKGAHL
jgi:hypothetical protein